MNRRRRKDLSVQEQGQTFGYCKHGGVRSGFEK